MAVEDQGCVWGKQSQWRWDYPWSKSAQAFPPRGRLSINAAPQPNWLKVQTVGEYWKEVTFISLWSSFFTNRSSVRTNLWLPYPCLRLLRGRDAIDEVSESLTTISLYHWCARFPTSRVKQVPTSVFSFAWLLHYWEVQEVITLPDSWWYKHNTASIYTCDHPWGWLSLNLIGKSREGPVLSFDGSHILQYSLLHFINLGAFEHCLATNKKKTF